MHSRTNSTRIVAFVFIEFDENEKDYVPAPTLTSPVAAESTSQPISARKRAQLERKNALLPKNKKPNENRSSLVRSTYASHIRDGHKRAAACGSRAAMSCRKVVWYHTGTLADKHTGGQTAKRPVSNRQQMLAKVNASSAKTRP